MGDIKQTILGNVGRDVNYKHWLIILKSWNSRFHRIVTEIIVTSVN